MKTYEMKLRIKCVVDYADPQDFEREIDQFNKACKDEIEVEVMETKEI